MSSRCSQVAALALALVLNVPVAAPAQAHSATIDDVLALRDFAAYREPITVSPDGSQLAFVTRTTDLAHNRYIHTIHVLETRANRQLAIADAGDTVLGSARGRRSGVAVERVALWSPDGRWLAYLVGSDGYAELLCVRPDGRNARRISATGEHVVSFSWGPDGSLVYRTALSTHVVAERLQEARTHGFHADSTFEPIYDVAPRIDDASPVSAWRVDIATGRRSEIPLDENSAPPGDVRIVPADPRYADAERPELALETIRGGETWRCAHELCQGDLIGAWSAGADNVVFLRQTGHHGALSEIAVWSPENGAARSIRLSEARLSGCTYDRDRLFCLEDSSTQPQRLISIDCRSGAREILYDPNPGWTRVPLPRVERLDTVNPGGQASYAHVVYPLNYVAGERYPLVIVQYRSRGFLRGGTGGEYPILPLSASGYFVLSVDRPEDFARARTLNPNEMLVATELDGSEAAMKQIAIEHFLTELDARGLIDPDRIAITGMSDGAETLIHMLLSSEWRFAAAVSSSAPPDPSVWAIQSAEFRTRRARFGGMAPWHDTDPAWADYWRRISPIYHLDRMRTPILFNLAETETLPALPLIARLQDMNAPHDLFVYPGAYHNKWRPAQLRAAQSRAMAWLDLWLRNIDTPDPREATRAIRWRAMRDAIAHGASSH